jgi:hypothetical protein
MVSIRGEKTESIAISDGAVMAGSVIPSALLGRVQQFIELNRAALIDYWEYRIDTEEYGSDYSRSIRDPGMLHPRGNVPCPMTEPLAWRHSWRTHPPMWGALKGSFSLSCSGITKLILQEMSEVARQIADVVMARLPGFVSLPKGGVVRCPIIPDAFR